MILLGLRPRQEHADYIKSVLELSALHIFEDSDSIPPEDKKKAEVAVPGNPALVVQAVST